MSWSALISFVALPRYFYASRAAVGCTSPMIVMLTFRMFDSANVISSSLSVVLPGSITEGRTAIGGT